MDFKDLTYIIAVAKYQNITKAADSLYISQPTLTKFIQHLGILGPATGFLALVLPKLLLALAAGCAGSILGTLLNQASA